MAFLFAVCSVKTKFKFTAETVQVRKRRIYECKYCYLKFFMYMYNRKSIAASKVIWATSLEPALNEPYVNNKGTFVVHCLDNIRPILAKYKISRLASPCSWAGCLYLTWSQTSKDRFHHDVAHVFVAAFLIIMIILKFKLIPRLTQHY